MEQNEFITTGVSGYSCFSCGDNIAPNDPVQICHDCGAVFCKPCVLSGCMENHECEEDEEEEE